MIKYYKIEIIKHIIYKNKNLQTTNLVLFISHQQKQILT